MGLDYKNNLPIFKSLDINVDILDLNVDEKRQSRDLVDDAQSNDGDQRENFSSS